MFGETKPPTAAQIAAAWGLARYLMSASPAAAARPALVTRTVARPARTRTVYRTSTVSTSIGV